MQLNKRSTWLQRQHKKKKVFHSAKAEEAALVSNRHTDSMRKGHLQINHYSDESFSNDSM